MKKAEILSYLGYLGRKVISKDYSGKDVEYIVENNVKIEQINNFADFKRINKELKADYNADKSGYVLNNHIIKIINQLEQILKMDN